MSTDFSVIFLCFTPFCVLLLAAIFGSFNLFSVDIRVLMLCFYVGDDKDNVCWCKRYNETTKNQFWPNTYIHTHTNNKAKSLKTTEEICMNGLWYNAKEWRFSENSYFKNYSRCWQQVTAVMAAAKAKTAKTSGSWRRTKKKWKENGQIYSGQTRFKGLFTQCYKLFLWFEARTKNVKWEIEMHGIQIMCDVDQRTKRTEQEWVDFLSNHSKVTEQRSST